MGSTAVAGFEGVAPARRLRGRRREAFIRDVARVDTSGRDVLGVLVGLERQRLEVAAGTLAAAARFVEVNPPVGLADFEGAHALAGVGAPAVAEYAISLVSACLGMSDFAARKLLGDAIELKHRLPRVWGLVQELVVPAWKVRGLCDQTRDLPLEAALWIDDRLARTPERINLGHIELLCAEALARFDPAGFTAAQAEAAEHRGVEIDVVKAGHRFATGAVCRVEMILDTPAAKQLQSTIGALAKALGETGSTEPLKVRRALAVGLLADPQAALDLLNQVGLPTKPEVATNLYVHLEATELAAETGVCFEERLGPITKTQLREWIGTGKVTIRPIIHHTGPDNDPASEPTVDQHDPSETIKEQVLLRNQVCVFPGCNRDSRACDLDHVIPYVAFGQPDHQPEQTRPTNLAPLCRYHHRVKTHAGWSYQIDEDGDTEWTDQRGHHHQKPAIIRRP